MPSCLIPAAQYLRMSTEHQQYSLENQAAAIREYANTHGFLVIATYSDTAKRGLWLKNRPGLRGLLQDVVTGKPSYQAILVYDVSRWGRFQDTDEAAHYEFLCKSAGIPIHYCAESFVNDTSLPNLIMKALKRTMAGEYSRELSVKVYDGQRRMAQLGFKQGGMPGYGLRRMLVSADGTLKQPLAQGDRKCLQTERVILTRGPAEEVTWVQEIFRMLIEDGLTVYSIANELNRRHVPYVAGGDWDYNAVYHVLTSVKYMGDYVWGRTTQKLGTKAAPVPQSGWVLVPGAFEAIVDRATFAKAQQILRARTINLSDEELLDRLRIVLKREGRLSHSLLETCPEIPSVSVYRARFGCMRKAYEMIGYSLPGGFGFLDVRQRTQSLRIELVERLTRLFPDDVAVVQRSVRLRVRLKICKRWLVSILISRQIRLTSGSPRWLVDPVRAERKVRTLLVRLNESQTGFHDFYLVPKIDHKSRFQLTENDEWLKTGRRLRNDLLDFRDAVPLVTERLSSSGLFRAGGTVGTGSNRRHTSEKHKLT